MSQELVKAYIEDVESFRQEHCHPEKKAGWLQRDRWFKKYHEALSKERAVMDYLVPLVGSSKVNSLVNSIAVILHKHQGYTELLLSGREPHAEHLRDLKNIFCDRDLQTIYDDILDAADLPKVDPRDYIPEKQALELWMRPEDPEQWDPPYKVFKRILKRNPRIRMNPRAHKRRPEVHAGDWCKFMREFKPVAPGIPSDEDLSLDYEGIEEDKQEQKDRKYPHHTSELD